MADFLDYVKDLEQGRDDISPEDLAPEPTTTAYNEEKDPEMERIEEAIKKWDRSARLTEALADDIRYYVASEPNPTYDGFMESQWANNKMTAERFVKDLKYLINHGVTPGSGKMDAGVSQKGAYGGESNTHGARKSAAKNEASGPYELDRGDLDLSGDMSKELAGLVSSYGDKSLKGDADEMFQDMQNIVRNIILQLSDKRHAVVYGDPGVGKCIYKDTLLTIQVEDNIAKELESFCI
jgi:hypothetical protein